MKVSTIKSCPSCGEDARLRKKSRTVIDGQVTRNCYVYCPNCDFRGPRVLYRDFENQNDAQDEAIARWNRRV